MVSSHASKEVSENHTLTSPPAQGEVSIQPYQFSINPEELAQAITEVSEQEALQQLAQPIIKLTQTLRNQHFSTVEIDDLKAVVEQVQTRVQPESKQIASEQCLDVIANYIEEEALNSEALAQALTALTHNLTQFRADETVSVVEELNTVISYYLPHSAVSSLGLNQETCEQLATAIADYLASSALESEEVTAGLERLNSSLNQLCTDDTVQAIEELNSTISNYKTMNIPGLERSLVDGKWVRSDKFSPEQFDQLFNVIQETTNERPNSQQSQPTDGADIGGRARTQLESVSDQARPHRSHDESTAITGAIRSGEPTDASPTPGFEALDSVTQRAEQTDRPPRTDGATERQSRAEIEQPRADLRQPDRSIGELFENNSRLERSNQQLEDSALRQPESATATDRAVAPTTAEALKQPQPINQPEAGQARPGIRANLESFEQFSQTVNQPQPINQSEAGQTRPGARDSLKRLEQLSQAVNQSQPINQSEAGQARPRARNHVQRYEQSSPAVKQPQPVNQPAAGQGRPRIRTDVEHSEESRQRISSACRNLASVTQQLQEIPLVELAPRLGLELDRRELRQWQSEHQRISINGQKFYDHLAQKGGYGAIDFVMHVKQQNFKEAVNWLSVTANSIPQTTLAEKSNQRTVNQLQSQSPAKLNPQQLWQQYSQRAKSPNAVSKQLEVARLAWNEGVPEAQIRQILQANPYLQRFGEKGVRDLVELPLRKVKAEVELSQQSQQQIQRNNQQRRQKDGPQL